MGGGGVSKRGKGGSDPSSPSSLPLFYIEVREAYASRGGGGRTAPPHHFNFFNKYKASFVEVKPKEEGCPWGNLVFGVTGRKIEQQKNGKISGFPM